MSLVFIVVVACVRDVFILGMKLFFLVRASTEPALSSSQRTGPHARARSGRRAHRVEHCRGGNKSRTSKKTNAHLLVEFGLELLSAALKREALSPNEVEHLQMLEFAEEFDMCSITHRSGVGARTV